MATKTPAGTVYSSGVIVGPRAKKPAYQQGVSQFSRDTYNANLAALGNPSAKTPEGAQAIAAAYNVAKKPFNVSPGTPGQPPPTQNYNPGGSGGGRGGGRRGGGGGGGGGGAGAAGAAAQNQINALASLLGSSAYQFDPSKYALDTSPYETMRTNVANATAQDQQAATGAYNALDTWLQQNQTNPYANVQLRQTAVAPSYNPYLQSQGIAGSAPVATNPDDSMAAFQNVLALLGANQQANNASGLRASQEARTYAGQQIGALDNAYLANIGNQQTAAQNAINQQRMQAEAAMAAEKRQAALQLMALLATPGTTAPDLSALGIA